MLQPQSSVEWIGNLLEAIGRSPEGAWKQFNDGSLIEELTRDEKNRLRKFLKENWDTIPDSAKFLFLKLLPDTKDIAPLLDRPHTQAANLFSKDKEERYIKAPDNIFEDDPEIQDMLKKATFRGGPATVLDDDKVEIQINVHQRNFISWYERKFGLIDDSKLSTFRRGYIHELFHALLLYLHFYRYLRLSFEEIESRKTLLDFLNKFNKLFNVILDISGAPAQLYDRFLDTPQTNLLYEEIGAKFLSGYFEDRIIHPVYKEHPIILEKIQKAFATSMRAHREIIHEDSIFDLINKGVGHLENFLEISPHPRSPQGVRYIDREEDRRFYESLKQKILEKKGEDTEKPEVPTQWEWQDEIKNYDWSFYKDGDTPFPLTKEALEELLIKDKSRFIDKTIRQATNWRFTKEDVQSIKIRKFQEGKYHGVFRVEIELNKSGRKKPRKVVFGIIVAKSTEDNNGIRDDYKKLQFLKNQGINVPTTYAFGECTARPYNKDNVGLNLFSVEWLENHREVTFISRRNGGSYTEHITSGETGMGVALLDKDTSLVSVNGTENENKIKREFVKQLTLSFLCRGKQGERLFPVFAGNAGDALYKKIGSSFNISFCTAWRWLWVGEEDNEELTIRFIHSLLSQRELSQGIVIKGIPRSEWENYVENIFDPEDIFIGIKDALTKRFGKKIGTSLFLQACISYVEDRWTYRKNLEDSDNFVEIVDKWKRRLELENSTFPKGMEFAQRLCNLGIIEITEHIHFQISPTIRGWLRREFKRKPHKPEKVIIQASNLSIKIDTQSGLIETVTDTNRIEHYEAGKWVKKKKCRYRDLESFYRDTMVLSYPIFPIYGEYGLKELRLSNKEENYRYHYITVPLEEALKNINDENGRSIAADKLEELAAIISNILVRMQEGSLRIVANEGIIPENVLALLLDRRPFPIDQLARNLYSIVSIYHKVGYSLAKQKKLLSRFITVDEIGAFMRKHDLSMTNAINILRKYRLTRVNPDNAVKLADILKDKYGISHHDALYFVTFDNPEEALKEKLELARRIHKKYKILKWKLVNGSGRTYMEQSCEVPFTDAFFFAKKYKSDDAEQKFIDALDHAKGFMILFNIPYSIAMFYIKTHGEEKTREKLETALGKAEEIQPQVNEGRKDSEQISISDIMFFITRNGVKGIKRRIEQVLKDIEELITRHGLTYRQAMRVEKGEIKLEESSVRLHDLGLLIFVAYLAAGLLGVLLIISGIYAYWYWSNRRKIVAQKVTPEPAPEETVVPEPAPEEAAEPESEPDPMVLREGTNPYKALGNLVASTRRILSRKNVYKTDLKSIDRRIRILLDRYSHIRQAIVTHDLYTQFLELREQLASRLEEESRTVPVRTTGPRPASAARPAPERRPKPRRKIWSDLPAGPEREMGIYLTGRFSPIVIEDLVAEGLRYIEQGVLKGGASPTQLAEYLALLKENRLRGKIHTPIRLIYSKGAKYKLMNRRGVVGTIPDLIVLKQGGDRWGYEHLKKHLPELKEIDNEEELLNWLVKAVKEGYRRRYLMQKQDKGTVNNTESTLYRQETGQIYTVIIDDNDSVITFYPENFLDFGLSEKLGISTEEVLILMKQLTGRIPIDIDENLPDKGKILDLVIGYTKNRRDYRRIQRRIYYFPEKVGHPPSIGIWSHTRRQMVLMDLNGYVFNVTYSNVSRDKIDITGEIQKADRYYMEQNEGGKRKIFGKDIATIPSRDRGSFVATSGMYTKVQHDKLNDKSENDIYGKRCIKITIKNGEPEIEIGENVPFPYKEFSPDIIKDRIRKILDRLGSQPETLEGTTLYLVPPQNKEEYPYYLRSETIDGKLEYQIAHAGSFKGKTLNIFMTYNAFFDFPLGILTSIVKREKKLARERYLERNDGEDINESFNTIRSVIGKGSDYSNLIDEDHPIVKLLIKHFEKIRKYNRENDEECFSGLLKDLISEEYAATLKLTDIVGLWWYLLSNKAFAGTGEQNYLYTRYSLAAIIFVVYCCRDYLSFEDMKSLLRADAGIEKIGSLVNLEEEELKSIYLHMTRFKRKFRYLREFYEKDFMADPVLRETTENFNQAMSLDSLVGIAADINSISIQDSEVISTGVYDEEAKEILTRIKIYENKIGTNTLIIPENEFEAAHRILADGGAETIVNLDSHRPVIYVRRGSPIPNNGSYNVINDSSITLSGNETLAFRNYTPTKIPGTDTELYEFDHHFPDKALRKHTATSLVVDYLRSLDAPNREKVLLKLRNAIFIQNHIDTDNFLAQWIIKNWHELTPEETDLLVAATIYSDHFVMPEKYSADPRISNKIRLITQVLWICSLKENADLVSYDDIFTGFRLIFPLILNSTVKNLGDISEKFPHEMFTILRQNKDFMKEAKAKIEALHRNGNLTVDNNGIAVIVSNEEIDNLAYIEFLRERFGTDVKAALNLKETDEKTYKVRIRLLDIEDNIDLFGVYKALNHREAEITGASAERKLWEGRWNAGACYHGKSTKLQPEEIRDIITRALNLKSLTYPGETLLKQYAKEGKEKIFYRGLAAKLGITGTVLDVGCSNNTKPLEGIREANKENIGIGVNDTDKTDEFAKKGLRFKTAYANTLPFDTETVNAVIFNKSLFHIAKSGRPTIDFEDNLDAALTEANRVLKEEGWIIIRPASFSLQTNQYVSQLSLAQLRYLDFKNIITIKDGSTILCIYAQKQNTEEARTKPKRPRRPEPSGITPSNTLAGPSGNDDMLPPWIIEEIERRRREKEEQDRPRIYDYDDPRLPPGWEPPKKQEEPKIERGIVVIDMSGKEIAEEEKRPKVISVLRVLSWAALQMQEIDNLDDIELTRRALKLFEGFLKEIRDVTEDNNLNSVLETLLNKVSKLRTDKRFKNTTLINRSLDLIVSALSDLAKTTEIDSLIDLIENLYQFVEQRNFKGTKIMLKLFSRLSNDLRKEVLAAEVLQGVPEEMLINRKIRDLECDFEDLDVLFAICGPDESDNYEYLFESIYRYRKLAFWQIGYIRSFYEKHKDYLEDLLTLDKHEDSEIRLKKALRAIKRAETIAQLEEKQKKKKAPFEWSEECVATPVDVINTMAQLEFYMSFIVRDLSVELVHSGHWLSPSDYTRLVEDDYELKDRWLALKNLLHYKDTDFINQNATILLSLAIDLLNKSKKNHSTTAGIFRSFLTALKRSRDLFLGQYREKNETRAKVQEDKTRAIQERDKHTEGDGTYEVYHGLVEQEEVTISKLEEELSELNQRLIGIEWEIVSLESELEPGYIAENIHEQRRIGFVSELFLRFRKYDGEKEQIDLNTVVDEVTTIANKEGVNITIEEAEGLPEIEANRSELDLVLLNLILNAEQSRKEDQKKVDINIRTSITDKDGSSWIVIEVANNGEIIPEDILSKLLKPNFEPAKEGKIGIGLSFVKKVINAYGGTIAIESSEEHGTKFTLRFKAVEDTEKLATDISRTAKERRDALYKKIKELFTPLIGDFNLHLIDFDLITFLTLIYDESQRGDINRLSPQNADLIANMWHTLTDHPEAERIKNELLPLAADFFAYYFYIIFHKKLVLNEEIIAIPERETRHAIICESAHRAPVRIAKDIWPSTQRGKVTLDLGSGFSGIDIISESNANETIWLLDNNPFITKVLEVYSVLTGKTNIRVINDDMTNLSSIENGKVSFIIADQILSDDQEDKNKLDKHKLKEFLRQAKRILDKTGTIRITHMQSAGDVPQSVYERLIEKARELTRYAEEHPSEKEAKLRELNAFNMQLAAPFDRTSAPVCRELRDQGFRISKKDSGFTQDINWIRIDITASVNRESSDSDFIESDTQLKQEQKPTTPELKPEKSGSIGKFESIIVESINDLPDSKVELTLRIIRLGSDKEEIVTVYGSRAPPSELDDFEEIDIEEIDNILERVLDHIKASSSSNIIKLDDNNLGINGIGTIFNETPLIAINESIFYDPIAQFHELAHLANSMGLLTLDEIINRIENNYILDELYHKKLTQYGYTSINAPEHIKFHYALRALQREHFKEEDEDLTDSIKQPKPLLKFLASALFTVLLYILAYYSGLEIVEFAEQFIIWGDLLAASFNLFALISISIATASALYFMQKIHFDPDQKPYKWFSFPALVFIAFIPVGKIATGEILGLEFLVILGLSSYYLTRLIIDTRNSKLQMRESVYYKPTLISSILSLITFYNSNAIHHIIVSTKQESLMFIPYYLNDFLAVILFVILTPILLIAIRRFASIYHDIPAEETTGKIRQYILDTIPPNTQEIVKLKLGSKRFIIKATIFWASVLTFICEVLGITSTPDFWDGVAYFTGGLLFVPFIKTYSYRKDIPVISIGGHSILTGSDVGDCDPCNDRDFERIVETQRRRLKETLQKILPLIENGGVITHGNGPEAGVLLQRLLGRVPDKHGDQAYLTPYSHRNESVQTVNHDTDPNSTSYIYEAGEISGLTEIIEEAQEWIGEDIIDILVELGIPEEKIELIITETAVDPDDPAFLNPTKRIGIPPADGPDNRVKVASPKPLKIVQLKQIRKAMNQGKIVICVGGGGIAINKDDYEEDLPAIIDKDMATALLIQELHKRGPPLERVIISTKEPYVYLNYGQPDQTPIYEATTAEIRQYIKEGHFEEGSMLPKIKAALEMVESGAATEVVITSSEFIDRIDEDNIGTAITKTQEDYEPEDIAEQQSAPIRKDITNIEYDKPSYSEQIEVNGSELKNFSTEVAKARSAVAIYKRKRLKDQYKIQKLTVNGVTDVYQIIEHKGKHLLVRKSILDNMGYTEQTFLARLSHALALEDEIAGVLPESEYIRPTWENMPEVLLIEEMSASPTLGANCTGDGWIGLNRVLYSITYQPAKDTQFESTLMHELWHEVNRVVHKDNLENFLDIHDGLFLAWNIFGSNSLLFRIFHRSLYNILDENAPLEHIIEKGKVVLLRKLIADLANPEQQVRREAADKLILFGKENQSNTGMIFKGPMINWLNRHSLLKGGNQQELLDIFDSFREVFSRPDEEVRTRMARFCDERGIPVPKRTARFSPMLWFRKAIYDEANPIIGGIFTVKNAFINGNFVEEVRINIEGMRFYELPIWPVDEKGKLRADLVGWMWNWERKTLSKEYDSSRKVSLLDFCETQPVPDSTGQLGLDFSSSTAPDRQRMRPKEPQEPAKDISVSKGTLDELDEILRVHNLAWQHNEHLQLIKEQMKRLIKRNSVYILKVENSIKGVLLTYSTKTDGDLTNIGNQRLWETMVKDETQETDPDTIFLWAIGTKGDKSTKGLHLGQIFIDKAKELFKDIPYLATFSPVGMISYRNFITQLRNDNVPEEIINEYGVYLYLCSIRDSGYLPYLNYILTEGFITPEEFVSFLRRKGEKPKLLDLVQNFHSARNGAVVAKILTQKEGYTRPDSIWTIIYGHKGFESCADEFRRLKELPLNKIKKYNAVKNIYSGLMQKIKEIYPGWTSISIEDLYSIVINEKLPANWLNLVTAMRADGIINEEDFKVVTNIGKAVENLCTGTDLTVRDMTLITEAISISYLIENAGFSQGFKEELQGKLHSLGYVSKAERFISFLAGIKKKIKQNKGKFEYRSHYNFIKNLEDLLGYRENEIFKEIEAETRINLADVRGNGDNTLTKYWSRVFKLNFIQWSVLDLLKSKTTPDGVIVQHIKDLGPGVANWLSGMKRYKIDASGIKMAYITEGLSEAEIKQLIKMKPANIVLGNSLEDIKRQLDIKCENIVYLGSSEELKQYEGEKIKRVLRGQAGPVVELSWCYLMLTTNDSQDIQELYRSFMDKLVDLGFITGEQINEIEDPFYIVLPKIESTLKIWENLHKETSYLEMWA